MDFLISIPDGHMLAAQLIDQVTEQENRRERTQIEKLARNNVGSIESFEGNLPVAEDVEKAVVVEQLYWDSLRAMPSDAALYMVLRHCLGKSCTEISAGLNVPYWKVKSGCNTGKMRALGLLSD